jgi:hypothetical protein
VEIAKEMGTYQESINEEVIGNGDTSQGNHSVRLFMVYEMHLLYDWSIFSISFGKVKQNISPSKVRLSFHAPSMPIHGKVF